MTKRQIWQWFVSLLRRPKKKPAYVPYNLFYGMMGEKPGSIPEIEKYYGENGLPK